MNCKHQAILTLLLQLNHQFCDDYALYMKCNSNGWQIVLILIELSKSNFDLIPFLLNSMRFELLTTVAGTKYILQPIFFQ